MLVQMMKSKIHRAFVTEAELNYIGSITIDKDIMDAADIVENEQVHVVNINNGQRFTTYAIEGAKGSGVICLNGACARLCEVDDRVIIITYCSVENTDRHTVKPKIVLIEENNMHHSFL